MATCYFTLNNIWTTTTTQRNISACKYVWEERGSNSRNSRAACGLKVTQRRLRKRIVSADKRWKASFRVEFLAFNKLLQPVSRNILEMLIFPPPPPSVFLSFSPEDRKNRKSGTIFPPFSLYVFVAPYDLSPFGETGERQASIIRVVNPAKILGKMGRRKTVGKTLVHLFRAIVYPAMKSGIMIKKRRKGEGQWEKTKNAWGGKTAESQI